MAAVRTNMKPLWTYRCRNSTKKFMLRLTANILQFWYADNLIISTYYEKIKARGHTFLTKEKTDKYICRCNVRVRRVSPHLVDTNDKYKNSFCITGHFSNNYIIQKKLITIANDVKIARVEFIITTFQLLDHYFIPLRKRSRYQYSNALHKKGFNHRIKFKLICIRY